MKSLISYLMVGFGYYFCAKGMIDWVSFGFTLGIIGYIILGAFVSGIGKELYKL